MTFSVIVPAFNEEKLLGGTLAVIRRAAVAFEDTAHNWELIVCDNNSTDATAEIAKAAGAKVVFEPVNQIARSRNRGASIALGDWLVFVDADTHPSYALFAELCGVADQPKIIGGGCTLEFDQASLMASCFVSVWNALSRALRWAAGSFVFCEAGAFRSLGGFNLDLYASEELDFSQRLRKLGKRSGRQLVILHRHPLITSSRKLRLYHLRAHLEFFVKALIWPNRTLKRREECALWYDGRR